MYAYVHLPNKAPESLTMNRVYRAANPAASNAQPPKLLDRLLPALSCEVFQKVHLPLIKQPMRHEFVEGVGDFFFA